MAFAPALAEEDAGQPPSPIGELAPIQPNPYLLALSQGLETQRRIAMRLAEALPAEFLPLAGLTQLLGGIPKSLEKRAYGFEPKRAEGLGRLSNILSGENVEMTNLIPAAAPLKLAPLAAAAGKALPFAAPLMAGMTKGIEPLVSALTKVEPVQDLFAALKGIAHQHAAEPLLTEGHPAIAHLPVQDQQSVIDWQKIFKMKYDIWGSPEGHAKYLAAGKSPPSGHSFEEYPPGWSDAVQAKFDELTGAATGQGPATSTLAGAGPTPNWHQPGTYVELKPGTYVELKPGTPPMTWTDAQEGWGHGTSGTNVGDTYATHSTGTELKNIKEGWGLEFPDGGKVGPFPDIHLAKHYFQEAYTAGLVPTKPGQFTAAELAAGQGPATNLSAGAGQPPVPIGTTSVPAPTAHGLGWKEEFSPMTGEKSLVHGPSGLEITGSDAGGFDVLDDQGTVLGSFNSLNEAKTAVETQGGVKTPQGPVLPPAPKDAWEKSGGPGEDLWEHHPSGFTIEKAVTGNYHIKPPGEKMVAFFPTLQEAKDAAELHHIKSASPPVTTVEGLAALPPTPTGNLPVDPWYHLHKRDPANVNWTYDPNPPKPEDAGLVATHASGTQVVSEGLKQNYLTKGGNKVGPFDTPFHAVEAYNAHYAMKNPQAASAAATATVTQSEQQAAVQALKDNYGITQDEIKMWLEYEPQMTPKKILERYEEAEKAAVKGGMPLEQYRNPDTRALESGALPYNLARGSYRQNPVPTAPITAVPGSAMRTSNSTGWAHPWIFTSDVSTGAQYFQSYPHQMEDLRALMSEERIFRPDWIKNHPDAPLTHEFEQTYDYLKEQEAAGRPFPAEYKPRAGQNSIFEDTGKSVMDRWRSSGHSAGYSHIERPDVALTLQQMGMKGFTTYERGGVNYALFHDVPLRWAKAPFDPRKKNIPGYFLGPAAAGAGSALLARELLLQHAGRGEEQ